MYTYVHICLYIYVYIHMCIHTLQVYTYIYLYTHTRMHSRMWIVRESFTHTHTYVNRLRAPIHTYPQCVAVCCSALQCVVACCNVLQCVIREYVCRSRAPIHTYPHRWTNSPMRICMCIYGCVWTIHLCGYVCVCTHTYRVAKTHRIPYLYRSFSAKVTYI